MSSLLLASFNSLPAFAQQLSLETVLEKAIHASYELQIARNNVAISQTDVKAARADYFPQIRSTFNSEYLKDLENTPQPVTTVGNTVIPAGTRFQASAGVSLNQNVLDFGVRKRKVEIAKRDVAAKDQQYQQTLRDLQIKLVDLYKDALLSYQALQANQSVLKLAQQVYQMQNRLYEAGTLSKVIVSEEAIQVAQALDAIEQHRRELDAHLQRMSYYTQEAYDIQSVELTDIQRDLTLTSVAFDETQSPEAQIVELEIEKKLKEVELLKRQRLPQVAFYSQYTLYGFDPDRIGKSFSNLSSRMATFGFSVNLPIFDGFKNQAAIERAQLEAEKLQLEKAQKLAELRTQAELYQQQITGYGVQLHTKAVIVDSTKNKLQMLNRLSDQQMVDQTQALKEEIQRIQKQLEADRMQTEAAASQKKLTLLSQGAS